MTSGELIPAMKDPESASTEVVEAVGGRKLFTPASNTDWATVEARQDEVDDILVRTEDPEHRVRELNQKFAKDWDDETGASFLHILGERLPGLAIHGNAQGLVVVGSELAGLDVQSADLKASVWSGSSIQDIKARGANLNMSIWGLTRITGDMTDVDAVDSNFNLAQLDVTARGARFAASFLIGTQGISPRNFQGADLAQSTVMPVLGQKGEKASIITN